MSLLAERERARVWARTQAFETTRSRLREALHELAPGCEFWLFGSVTVATRFNLASDVDLAFVTLPAGMTEFLLAAELEERIGRPVDIVDFQRTRLRPKIEREGERWIA